MTGTRRVHFNLHSSAVLVGRTEPSCKPRVLRTGPFFSPDIVFVCTEFLLITCWRRVLQRGPEVNPHHKAVCSLKEIFMGRINSFINAEIPFGLQPLFKKNWITCQFFHNEKVWKELSFHLKVFYRLGMAAPELLVGFRLSPLQSQSNYFLNIFSVWKEAVQLLQKAAEKHNNWREMTVLMAAPQRNVGKSNLSIAGEHHMVYHRGRGHCSHVAGLLCWLRCHGDRLLRKGEASPRCRTLKKEERKCNSVGFGLSESMLCCCSFAYAVILTPIHGPYNTVYRNKNATQADTVN